MVDSNTSRTYTPQAGIFALGTSSHAYLEFDLVDSNKVEQLLSAIAGIREPRTTTGGVNFVIGFRPELWQAIAPDDAPQHACYRQASSVNPQHMRCMSQISVIAASALDDGRRREIKSPFSGKQAGRERCPNLGSWELPLNVGIASGSLSTAFVEFHQRVLG